MINLLKSRGCFEISFSYNLITRLAIFNSRNFIFINLIILTIKELSIYKSIIAIISSLNNR